MNKFFNNRNDYFINQQLIGHIDLFRGVIVKELVMGNHNISKFYAHDKVLVKSCVHFYHKH